MYECAKNNAHNVDLNWSSEGFSQKSAYLLDLIKKKNKNQSSYKTLEHITNIREMESCSQQSVASSDVLRLWEGSKKDCEQPIVGYIQYI